MNCRKVSTFLPFLVYGELNKKERKIVSDHIAVCKRCKKAYADYQKIQNLLTRWTEQPVGKRLFPDIIEYIKPEILTPEELAAYLRVSPDDILTNIETIPHIRLGKSLRFHRETIIQWIREGEGKKEPELLDELTDWKFLINRAHNN